MDYPDAGCRWRVGAWFVITPSTQMWDDNSNYASSFALKHFIIHLPQIILPQSKILSAVAWVMGRPKLAECQHLTWVPWVFCILRHSEVTLLIIYIYRIAVPPPSWPINDATVWQRHDMNYKPTHSTFVLRTRHFDCSQVNCYLRETEAFVRVRPASIKIYFHLRFVLSSGSFPSDFSTKTPYALICRNRPKNWHCTARARVAAFNSF
jgi:hypothetical protein